MFTPSGTTPPGSHHQLWRCDSCGFSEQLFLIFDGLLDLKIFPGVYPENIFKTLQKKIRGLKHCISKDVGLLKQTIPILKWFRKYLQIYIFQFPQYHTQNNYSSWYNFRKCSNFWEKPTRTKTPWPTVITGFNLKCVSGGFLIWVREQHWQAQIQKPSLSMHTPNPAQTTALSARRWNSAT